MENGSLRMDINKKRERKIILFSTGFLVIFFVWLIAFTGELSTFSLLRFALLIILSYIAMVIDISTKRIPNVLVLIMVSGWLLLIIPMISYDTSNGLRLFADSIYGFLTGGGLFLLVYIISRKGLGGGDVKFMAAVGLYLGFAEILPAILYGTVFAAITGLILIVFKKMERKGTIPLVPFLFTGIMITIFTH